MQEKIVTAILGGGQGSRLWPLTRDRAKPAVPVGGKFRLIDIPISNSLHAGIDRIFVITQFNSASLHRHIAQTYRFIDIDKAGIWGHSGGGFATAAAMFRYPDFFKVGISESGNHDNRAYEDDWGERYQGMLMTAADSAAYEAASNQSRAKNLKGKLFLIHGQMDDNVPPYNTQLVVNALMRSGKDFDQIMLPPKTHILGTPNRTS